MFDFYKIILFEETYKMYNIINFLNKLILYRLF